MLQVLAERPVLQPTRALYSAFRADRIPRTDLPAIIASLWVWDDSPTSNLRDEEWLEMFHSAGFFYATADPRTGIRPEHLRYRFKHCVRATATTALSPEIWRRSLDDRLIDHEQGRGLDGYAWGVKWQDLYPGMQLVHGSADAARWARELGIPFHEATIETNGHNISLVFSDLTVDTVDAGYAPFVIPGGGPDFKIPLR